MSTFDKLQALLDSGGLVHFVPEMEGFEVEKRRLLLTPSVYKWVTQQPQKRSAAEYHAKVYAYLKDFVVGEPIDDFNNAKQTSPFETDIWSLKILFDPQCRILGAFVLPDCFIGLHRAERKKLDFPKHIRRAIREWGNLLPGVRRLTGTRFEHYVSNGVERDPRKSYS